MRAFVKPVCRLTCRRAARPYSALLSAEQQLTVDEVMQLYKSSIGHSNYDPFCTQLEHGLQTMARAKEEGASGTVQLQGFLHDVADSMYLRTR